MFTGIIKNFSKVTDIQHNGSNLDLWLRSEITSDLSIDQSVAHNGICLTVVAIQEDQYKVTAISETIQRTNIGDWKLGENINIELAMAANHRFDGHMVQGHIDQTATCQSIIEQNGSWLFTFHFENLTNQILVDKGSICVNGVSLTVVKPSKDEFSVAIIPFTFENTNFKNLVVGSKVNIEFDIFGKYFMQYVEVYKSAMKDLL